ncbi:MAG: toprim domain-containing protein [Candidatus Altiarchaeota archaeon]
MIEGLLLEDFLDSLGDSVILVEGRKDKAALVSLGVKGENIVEVKTELSILETVEALSDQKDVVILTDMDRAGKGLRRRLLAMFSQYGITENKGPRDLFARLRLSHVEGL